MENETLNKNLDFLMDQEIDNEKHYDNENNNNQKMEELGFYKGRIKQDYPQLDNNDIKEQFSIQIEKIREVTEGNKTYNDVKSDLVQLKSEFFGGINIDKQDRNKLFYIYELALYLVNGQLSYIYIYNRIIKTAEDNGII